MILTCDILKKITCGAEEILESPRGVEFTRFNKEERKLYASSTLESRTHTPAGVELRFKTDSNCLNIDIEAECCLDRSYFCLDVFCNDKLIGCINNFDESKMTGFYSWNKFPLGSFFASFNLGFGEKEVRIVLPWSVRTYFKKIELENASYIEGIKPQKCIIMYGDSITHGYDSVHPSTSYSVRLAHTLGYECFIKAVGGEKFFPDFALVPQVRKPEIVTVACGTNDWSSKNKELFDKNSSIFIENICKNYPESKIFVLSPIWRKDNVHKEGTGTEFDDIHYVERTLQSICKSYSCVHFLRGWDFVPHNENLYGDLRLHPNDEGFRHYADSLYKAICLKDSIK